MLLDRDQELDVIAELLADAGGSGGRVVLVRGEAGIGKSALVREFFGGHGDEAHVYFGFCDDLLTPQPLGAFWDIAREEPSLGESLEKGDRRAVMEVLLDLLSRSLRPTVLVVEDTHWADEATLDAIKYLGRRIARTNGLLLLTYRDGEVDYDHPLDWKGDWAAAEDIATEVLGSHPHVEVLTGCVLGRLQARRGRPEARATLDRTWSLAESSGEMQNLLPTAAAQAEYMWLTGEADPDRSTRFREVLDEGVRLGGPWPAGSLALWRWKLDEFSEAPEGIAEPYRLIIEGRPMAAAQIWEKKGVPYERAIALAHGDHTAQLEALETLETLGATAVATKLRKTLRDQGVSVPRGKGRKTRRHTAGLTARQAEVLHLLDEGLSNPEIADRLFVSCPRSMVTGARTKPLVRCVS